jgi:hypothetical protein
MSVVGVVAIVTAIAFALSRSFQRAGLFEKFFGWSALRSFSGRTGEVLTSTPLLIALLALGVTLLLAAALTRK